MENTSLRPQPDASSTTPAQYARQTVISAASSPSTSSKLAYDNLPTSTVFGKDFNEHSAAIEYVENIEPAFCGFDEKVRELSLAARRMRGGIDLFTSSFKLHTQLLQLQAALRSGYHVEKYEKPSTRWSKDTDNIPETVVGTCDGLEGLMKCLLQFAGHFGLVEQEPLMSLHDCFVCLAGQLDLGSTLPTPTEKQILLSSLRALRPKLRLAERALRLFVDHDVPAILARQDFESSSMLLVITISTFFSGVSVSAIQVSVALQSSAPSLDAAVNACFILSLILSVAASIVQLLAIFWQSSVHRSDSKDVLRIHEYFLLDMPLFFLSWSMTGFVLGVVLFSWASQRIAVSVIITVIVLILMFLFMGAFVPVITDIGNSVITRERGLIQTADGRIPVVSFTWNRRIRVTYHRLVEISRRLKIFPIFPISREAGQEA
ncbi:hypothetical protein K488DRAFT_90054 [Vararia minispora EC-137]|uniref:Uncharacterized protein n=1 Tax=Vararia minispora EC-137 TaxID=1314806 RepID=A0ACB8Q9E6_9AGAM|nr:hypothetical protein K488DRAFT_90054 [Vararia minispora EC-137]